MSTTRTSLIELIKEDLKDPKIKTKCHVESKEKLNNNMTNRAFDSFPRLIDSMILNELQIWLFDILNSYELYLISQLPAADQGLKTISFITPKGLFQIREENKQYKYVNVLDANHLKQIGFANYLSETKELTDQKISLKNKLTPEQLEILEKKVLSQKGHTLLHANPEASKFVQENVQAWVKSIIKIGCTDLFDKNDVKAELLELSGWTEYKLNLLDLLCGFFGGVTQQLFKAYPDVVRLIDDKKDSVNFLHHINYKRYYRNCAKQTMRELGHKYIDSTCSVFQEIQLFVQENPEIVASVSIGVIAALTTLGAGFFALATSKNNSIDMMKVFTRRP